MSAFWTYCFLSIQNNKNRFYITESLKYSRYLWELSERHLYQYIIYLSKSIYINTVSIHQNVLYLYF